jgi:hypothetical protein
MGMKEETKWSRERGSCLSSVKASRHADTLES